MLPLSVVALYPFYLLKKIYSSFYIKTSKNDEITLLIIKFWFN